MWEVCVHDGDVTQNTSKTRKKNSLVGQAVNAKSAKKPNFFFTADQ